MTSVFSKAALLAGVMTLGLATAAVAADSPAPADGKKVERRVVVMGGPGHPGGPGGMMFMGGPGGHHRMDPEKHAEHLRTLLQLRPDQEGALKAFIAATTPPPPPEPKAPPAADAPPPKPLTTPERLALAEKRMAEHQAAFAKRAAATRAFYAQLSPSQQKVFDELHGMMRGMRGMHHPGGPGGRDVRIMRRGGPGHPPMPPHPPHPPAAPGGAGGGDMMIWEGEAPEAMGEDQVFFIMGGPEGVEEFELEVEVPEGK